MTAEDETYQRNNSQTGPGFASHAPINLRGSRLVAALLATLVMLLLWKTVGDQRHTLTTVADEIRYQNMADGTPAIKPFAYRVLGPAAARSFAEVTGRSTGDGFLALGLASGWILFYCILSPVLRLQHGLLFASLLTLLPFWERNFRDYFFPDPLHAAFCAVYFTLLRKRWWGWSSAILATMFLVRESTLLVAIIAVPVLWRLVGRRVGLMQFAAAVAGMAASKFAVRHALANEHNLNDTLYMLGKVPWNISKNVFGLFWWTNTEQAAHPVKIWTLPHWIHLGQIHQVGFSGFVPSHPSYTALGFLSCFGLGACAVFVMLCRTPLRTLLPRDEPYLYIAAIYGLIAYLAAPALGTAFVRLFDYAWPLFLIYLPVMMTRLWRSWPAGSAAALVALHLLTAWLEPTLEHRGIWIHGVVLTALIVANIAAVSLLWRAASLNHEQEHSQTHSTTL